ncbi:putative strand invasion [Lyophyllum shimeji]|uniref:Strand invasion n=1 Tax=Lyophyllum shimeji TaxID=47721 RepID=A0A9P3USD5_LYOSH|nr:putative strand invasion [Lyophyllum shimeji]
MSSRPLSSLSLSTPTLALLTRAGYATVQDLQTVSAQALAQDARISLTEAEIILSSCQRPNFSQSLAQPSLTQSAASMANDGGRLSTKCPGIDELLSGGLARGQVLEISGPPGSPKEAVAMDIATSFVEAGHEVIFVDSQNMTSPATLDKVLNTSTRLPPNYSRLVYHSSIQTLLDLMVFIHNLPKLLDSYPKVTLLVLNSISFPFQCSHNLNIPARTALLGKIKQALTVVSATRNVTVVTTSQLSTKILNADGSSGSFDTGAKGVMVPQLGAAYLPGRAYRIILAAEGPTSGSARLISSPGDPQGTGPLRLKPYEVTRDGKMR